MPSRVYSFYLYLKGRLRDDHEVVGSSTDNFGPKPGPRGPFPVGISPFKDQRCR